MVKAKMGNVGTATFFLQKEDNPFSFLPCSSISQSSKNLLQQSSGYYIFLPLSKLSPIHLAECCALFYTIIICTAYTYTWVFLYSKRLAN
jgi:hypothetical protein